MKKFDNLLQFITYCESVEEDNNDLFLISMLASHLTKEEFLNEVFRCLDVYYFWLKQAIKEEMYYMAAQIVTAKQCEIEHYILLAQAVIREEDIKQDIINIDIELNNKILNGTNN